MVLEEIIKSITDSISGWLGQFGGSFIDFIADNVDNFNISYREGWTGMAGFHFYNWLAAVHKRVVFFAWMVLALRLIVDGTRIYIAREAGEISLSPMVLFRRLIITVATMTIISFFFAYGHHGISDTMQRLIKENASGYSRLVIEDRNNVYSLGRWYPRMKPWLEDFQAGWQIPDDGETAIGAVAIKVTVAMTVGMGILTFFIQLALREIELIFAWLTGPIFALSPMTTDDPLREGGLVLWLREVMVISFNQVTTMIVMILLWELVDPTTLAYPNGNIRNFGGLITILVLITIGIQGPRIFRQFAWGNTQAQGVASQLIRLPW